ncbi:hypothetical protein TWF730_003216 [Orbilia blumenaviensis]|uniref:Secreted protein n=1 Tax=Orbilia blumenaviensis TaxID=1796055 RepID=A0AAV9U867_9PEZI
MKCRKSLLLTVTAVTTACVHAATVYPEYRCRIGYQAETLEQYDPKTGALLVDSDGNPVLTDYELLDVRLFGGASCVSAYPGANSLRLIDFPQELHDLIGPDREVGLNNLFGWVMYPGSNACNLDLAPDDPNRQQVVLSLDQARYGYTQTENIEEFSGFPETVSFRLFVNPALFSPEGVESFIDLPFSAVGKNSAIPRQHINSGEMDWSVIGGGKGELDPNNPVVRQYAPFGLQVIQPEGVTDRIAAPARRIRPGNPGHSENVNDYRPYPDLYSFTDPRKPMEVFRSITMLARLGDDLDSGKISMSELEAQEEEVDAFAEAFMGLPLPPADPEAEYLVPTRYDWPPLSLLSYLNNLEGFVMPAPAMSFYSRDGRTFSEAIGVAQTLNAAVEQWLEDQGPDVIGDWGVESSPQLRAEEWLYYVEDGVWEDTGSMQTIPDDNQPAASTRGGGGGKPGLTEADQQRASIVHESVEFQPKPPVYDFEDLPLDSQPNGSGLEQEYLKISFPEAPAGGSQIPGGSILNQNPSNTGPIITNLENRYQASRAGSRELQDQNQDQIQIQNQNQNAEINPQTVQDDPIRETLDDIINQLELQQQNPVQDILNEGANQDEIQRNDLIQEVADRVVEQAGINAPIDQNQIADINENERERDVFIQDVVNGIIDQVGAQPNVNSIIQQQGPVQIQQQQQAGAQANGNAANNGDDATRGRAVWGNFGGGRKRSPGPDW